MVELRRRDGRLEGMDDRIQSALNGIAIGDALAMPVHWYYDRAALVRDYGHVADFVKPKNPHPDSIFWRSSWDAPRPELDILGDQRPFWGVKGVHYHQNLKAGEATLTGKLAALTWESLDACGGYNAGDYLERYIDLLTNPERHRDTYLEECHRGFFTNLGRGKKPNRCAVNEKHIGGLVPMLAVALYYAEDEDAGRKFAKEHLALTHGGMEMQQAADALLSILYPVLSGASLEESILDQVASQRNPLYGFPYRKWLGDDDSKVIGPRLSTACYVDGAVPAVVYLALKYSERSEESLIANTNLGGDNVHRGGALGCLLGAANVRWPDRWLSGLAK